MGLREREGDKGERKKKKSGRKAREVTLRNKKEGGAGERGTVAINYENNSSDWNKYNIMKQW